MLGIDHDTGITRCTTGRVDTNGIIQTTTYQTVGIVVAKVLLRGEGDLAKVIEAVDRVGSDACITQTLLLERRLQGNLNALLQFLNLQLLKLLSWHGL